MLVAAGLAAAVGVLALTRRAPRATVAGAALVCAAAGAAGAGLRVAALAQGPLPVLARERAVVAVELVITSDPRRVTPRAGGRSAGQGSFVVDARVEVVEGRGVRTAVRTPVVVLAGDAAWADLLPGQRLRASGRLAEADRGAAAALLLARGPPAPVGEPSLLQRGAGDLRAGLREAVEPLGDKPRGLVPGLVVGDTSRLPAPLEEDFRAAGLTHLVAVSGANCAIVVGFVLYVGARARLPRRAAPWVGALALAGFVVLARPQPSVLRAAVMGALALAALASGRRRHGAPALCAAAVLLLLLDPWLARSYGFALSVLATGGILVLVPAWTDRLARWLPRPIAAALAVPCAAQVACAPVVVLLSEQVSLVAVPANLLVAPAVAPATVAGVLAAISAPLAPPLAAVFGRVASVPASWIIAVAEAAAGVPHASLPWPGGVGGAVALGLVLVAVVTLAPRLWTPPRALAVVLAAALTLGGVRASAPPWPPPGWLLVACDVGQGDALVLDAGGGAAVVVDAGPDPDAVDRCLGDLGVRRVAVLVLSHLHADHVDGVPGVLRRRRVDSIAVGPLDEPHAQAVSVGGWAARAGVPVRRVRAGETVVVGDLRWRVLWPRRVIRGEGSVPNNASVAVLAERAGVRMLLTGDVEPAAQAGLLAALGGQRVDVLKVPHHGSPHQDPRLLTGTGARVALVSVGTGNDYGHPSEDALAMVRASGARVLRTDLDGDVAVLGPIGGLGVVARNG